MYSKIALALAASAAVANALTTAQSVELETIMSDVESNLSDYISLATDGTISLSDLPSGVLNLGLAIASATDDSYTTLYDAVDMAAVETWLSVLPWYSTRLSSEIAAALYTVTAEASSAAASSAEATSTEASSSAEATSTEAASSAAASSTEAASSEAASTEASSSAAATTSSSSAAASTTVSAATSSSVSSTAAVSQQTANGAAKAVSGLGAGVLAAAALLL
ncbi:hypothetical protein DAKH74_028650 [Maudiozyma humilis]|uniref:Uncharacterized protein n=1 Tax=Maudiozyma humilis TaxID=51915 RepID=A0AAV5RXA6_MAUHU|nr:hypothetical protein DAKH74_028650 [Kazachstania humilis]